MFQIHMVLRLLIQAFKPNSIYHEKSCTFLMHLMKYRKTPVETTCLSFFKLLSMLSLALAKSFVCLKSTFHWKGFLEGSNLEVLCAWFKFRMLFSRYQLVQLQQIVSDVAQLICELSVKSHALNITNTSPVVTGHRKRLKNAHQYPV